ADLDRIANAAIFESTRADWDENREFLNNRMAVMLEHCITLTVARPIRIFLTNGQCGGSPEPASLFIANVDGLGLRVANGIVVPGRNTIRLTVSEPGKTKAAFTHHGAESRICHHVDPRRGRGLSRAKIRSVFAAVAGEATDPVEIRKFQERQR